MCVLLLAVAVEVHSVCVFCVVSGGALSVCVLLTVEVLSVCSVVSCGNGGVCVFCCQL